MDAAGPFEGRGHGKLILAGEHAVVYGHPAVALAVDRGVRVRLTRRPGPTAPAPGTPEDDRLRAALAQALPPSGWEVAVDADLPTGRGMGSSAAFAVGLVRAWAAAEGRPLDEEACWEAALAVERIFHGTPSGLDHAVSGRGGALRFVRGEPPHITPLPCPAWPLVVLDSGTAGDTRALVAGVRSRRPAVDPVLDAIGALVPQVEAALDDPAALGPLLTRNHALLRDLGVSTPTLDRLVELALGAGAWGAKLAGAGGGGVVLAVAPAPERVVSAVRAAGFGAFACRPVPAHAPPEAA
jgi:mevalonate kinase